MVHDPSNEKRPWKCDFSSCTQRFRSDEKLKKHMRENDDHDYCQYCNTAFEDWDALTAHKTEKAAVEINVLKEWEKRELRRQMKVLHGWSDADIEREREKDPKPSLRHLCCKLCGMDFGSVAGRDTHINQQHQIDQELPCPGNCGLTFPRASALVYHIEYNECPKISHDQFAGYLQHKAIVTRLLANPELITELESNDYLEASNDTSEAGGVKLSMLEDVGTGDILGAPLEPERSMATARMPGMQQTWPDLRIANPPSKPIDLLSEFESMSIASTAENYKPKKIIANPIPIGEEFPALGSPAESCTTIVKAWSTGAASSTLFPGAKPTPPPSDFQSLFDAQSEADYRSNILQYQFWNPAHRDYNPERFYNPMLEEYRCPFPICDKGVKTPFELERHIKDTHKIDRIRCPQCLKLFKSHTALISHCESATNRCRLNKSDRFGQIMDEFSGGLLSARRAARPDNDEAVDGTKIDYVEFKSHAPEDLRRQLAREERVKMITGGVDIRGGRAVGVAEKIDDRGEEERKVEDAKRAAIPWYE